MPLPKSIQIRKRKFFEHYNNLTPEQREETAIVFKRKQLSWSHLHSLLQKDNHQSVVILKALNLDRTRLIDMLDPKSLEVFNKFGKISTDKHTGKKHFYPERNAN